MSLARGRKQKRELEQRLKVSYDAGYFDGYYAGAVYSHDLWISELLNVKGVGPKTFAAIMEHMATAILEKQKIREEDDDDQG